MTTNSSKIPFFKSTLGEEEKKAISDCIDSGWVVQGPKTREFEEKFAEYVGAKHAVFVDSGTSALLLCMRYNKIFDPQPHEAKTPSLTFVSDGEVAYDWDHRLEWLDVNRKTFCIEDHPQKPNFKTIAVNLTGNLVDKGFMNVSGNIIDSAHRIEKDDVKGSKAPWCYSFYTTKNMTTVQGGMVATNDDHQAEWFRKDRDHGISKGTLERYTQKTPTYDIEFIGHRCKGDDLRAVIGLEQLKKLPWMTQRRNEIVKRYNNNFNLDRTGNHLYPILVSNRDRFFELMEGTGIQLSVHFLPLDLMTAYKKYSPCEHAKFLAKEAIRASGDCKLPNTHYLGARLVSIPLFPTMTDDEIDYVSECVLKTNLLLHE